MSDQVPQAAPTIAVPQPLGGNPVQTLPGTSLPLPVGSGVERLIPINAPFRTNAPPWYTPPGTVWSQLGCAVPQVGRYLQTNNEIIFDFVNVVGASLFNTMWKFDDRKFARFPSRECLYEVHQLLTVGRSRLVAKTTLPNQTPLLPTKATPVPKMFLVYPVPLYGPLGCVNQWLRLACEMSLLMTSEAMQHSDNELGYHVTKPFFDTCYGYIKYLIVDMATKFFGEDPAIASADNYLIPDSKWAAYNPAQYSVSVEATSTRPPMGYKPTDLDLEPIRGLPIENVIGFLQPWPDSQLQYSTGGIWGNASSPSADALNNNPSANVSSNVNLFKQPGPPSA